MPGRLMAEHNVSPPKAPAPGIGKQSVNNTTPAVVPVAQQSPSAARAPPPTPIPELHPSNGTLTPTARDPAHGGPTTLARRSSLDELPPEIRHITEGYHPLSRLLGRASQECFNGLNELVSQLAQQPDSSQVNGSRQNSDPSQPTPGARKRLQWLEFANSQREKFIKLLVIVQWSKKVDDIAKLVDIGVWNGEQRTYYDDSKGFLGNLRRNMAVVRRAAPDIENALEVLTNGGLRDFGDLAFVPLEPLPAQRLLKELRNLDVLLHTRLNFYEDLPHHFRRYSIGSGRVTFRVKSEFEVDLSIADEDPSSQFWFVDLRLLFTSQSETLNAQLRALLEPRVNTTLLNGGLTECYELLHEFTLTHRITLLRSQATAMSRGSWTDALHVESLHRSLVVQYWPKRLGKKSWIQIGIRSKEHDDREEDETSKTARLFMKWFCDGKEVKDQAVCLEDQQLDLESMLKKVVARHISSLLSHTKDRFRMAIADGTLDTTLRLSTSDDEPADCMLRVPTSASNNGAILIEYITGDYALQPVSPGSTIYQTVLNSNKEAINDPFPVLERWRASEIQRIIEHDAERAGLQLLRPHGTETDAVRHAFGTKTLAISFFATRHWLSTGWTIALAISSHDRVWWIAKIDSGPSRTRIMQEESIPDTETSLDATSVTTIPRGLERKAAATVCLSVACAQLKRLRVPHLVIAGASDASDDLPSLQFDAQTLLAPSLTGTSLLATKTCTLRFRDFDNIPSSATTVTCTFRGRLDLATVGKASLQHLQSYDLKIDNEGQFILSVSSLLGSEAPITRFGVRLRSVYKLSTLLSIISRLKMPFESIDPSTMKFHYSKDPALTATITIGANNVRTITFEPSDSNPHKRLVTQINNGLYDPFIDISRISESIVRIILFSQSVLTTFDTLEKADPSATRVHIHIHSLSDYRVRYRRVDLTLRINVVSHRDRMMWAIRPLHPIIGNTSTEYEEAPTWKRNLNDRVKAFFSWEGRQHGRVNLTTGVAAISVVAGRVLTSLDIAIAACEASVPPLPKRVKAAPSARSPEPTKAPQPTADQHEAQQGEAGTASASGLSSQREVSRQSPNINGTNAPANGASYANGRSTGGKQVHTNGQKHPKEQKHSQPNGQKGPERPDVVVLD